MANPYLATFSFTVKLNTPLEELLEITSHAPIPVELTLGEEPRNVFILFKPRLN